MTSIIKDLKKFNHVLITGAAGFIGCNFVRYMLNKYKNIQIISYDKLTYAGSLDNLHDVLDNPNHIFIKGDICNEQLVAHTLRKYNINAIVHFAAESHVDNSIEKPQDFIQTNIHGTFTLLEQAKRYWLEEKQWGDIQCRFHHASTDEVYGSLGLDEEPFTETSPYQPNSPYAASKAASDHLVRAYFKTYGLPATISNCSNNYGPNQHSEKFIPTVIHSGLENKPIPVYGNGANIRDWLHVVDHCHALDLILQQGQAGESYNIGGGFEISNLELAKKIIQIIQQQNNDSRLNNNLINYVNDRKGHDFRYAINAHKIKKELGWEPKYAFNFYLNKRIAESFPICL